MEADICANTSYKRRNYAFLLFEGIEKRVTWQRDRETLYTRIRIFGACKSIEVIRHVSLQALRFIIKNQQDRKRLDKGEEFVSIKKCHICCTRIPSGCYFLVATKRIPYSRKLHAVTRRITRLKRRKTAEKRRFERTLRRISSSQMLTRNTPRVTARTSLR